MGAENGFACPHLKGAEPKYGQGILEPSLTMAEFLSQICTAVARGGLDVYAQQHDSINVMNWTVFWKRAVSVDNENTGWKIAVLEANRPGDPFVLLLTLTHDELEALREPIRTAIDDLASFYDVGEILLQGDLKLSAKKIKDGNGPLWFSLQRGAENSTLRFGSEKGCALIAVLHMLIELVEAD